MKALTFLNLCRVGVLLVGVVAFFAIAAPQISSGDVVIGGDWTASDACCHLTGQDGCEDGWQWHPGLGSWFHPCNSGDDTNICLNPGTDPSNTCDNTGLPNQCEWDTSSWGPEWTWNICADTHDSECSDDPAPGPA